MATIAPISSKLTLNTATYIAGLARARKATTDLVGGALGSATTKVIGFGAALTAAATGGGMALMVSKSMENIDALAKTADKLGLTTDNLARLRYAADLAGVGNEQFDKSLQKMVLNLGEAARGGGEARGVIAQLGLDAQALAGMTPDAAFREIAQAITQVPSATDRASMAFRLFGKEGVSMLNVMAGGKEGLAAAAEEADKLGLSITRVDAAKVEAANDAMSRAKYVFEGAANAIAVQLAPWIETAATKFMEMATSGDGMSKRVINAFEWVVTGIAKAADWLELAKAGFYGLQAAATAQAWATVKAIDFTGYALTELINLLPGVEVQWTSTFDRMADNLADSVIEATEKAGQSFDRFQSGANAAAVVQTFNDIRSQADAAAQAIADNVSKTHGVAAATEDWADKLQAADDAAKKIDDTLTDLHSKVETFGMSDSQKAIFDLRAMGASPEQLAEAHAALDQLEQMQARQDALKSMQDDAKSIFDSTRTPMEQYTAQLDRLNQLLGEGAIDYDTYGRAVRQARAELEKANDIQAPKLVTAGSAQAQRLAYAAGRPSSRGDDLPKRQLAIQERMARTLESIDSKAGAGDEEWEL